MPGVGLLAPKPIVWLLKTDKEVKAAVQRFVDGRSNGNVVDVAGPPDIVDLMRARAQGRKNIDLPTIRLNLKRTRHHLTGVPCVEITCAEAHMDMLIAWSRQSQARAQFADATPLM